MPGMPKNPKLPSGQELTYFIFDGAKDLTTSKSWAQIQRPLIVRWTITCIRAMSATSLSYLAEKITSRNRRVDIRRKMTLAPNWVVRNSHRREQLTR
jgi:hypothetical protein